MKKLRNNGTVVCAVALVVILVGCAQRMDTQSVTKVTNGLPAPHEFPSVVMLEIDEEMETQICTGTFVNDSQLVTAAHCIYKSMIAGKSPSIVSITKLKHQRINAIRWQHHPDYSVKGEPLRIRDIAVVTFPAGTSSATTRLYQGALSVGQDFTIIGFGANAYEFDSNGNPTSSGLGIKRKGQNQIDEITGGLIKFKGVASATDKNTPLGLDVASGTGDSGGPLLIQEMLAAVTSGGGLQQTTGKDGQVVDVKKSIYTDLNEPLNRKYLMEALVTTPGW